MRSLLIAMAMIAAAPAAHAADWPGPAPSTTAPLLQLAQAQPDTINRNIPQQGSNVRPPRYVCIIKPPASDAGAGRYSCPASAGRVGESCRCANAVGSGKLRQY
ncbi:hypothetical protein [Agrobacterium vitis]|uniref:Uncharacterized protein n=1 Tax=Agrobacterium vitis TaxID=373 RepID=A0AAE2REU3_AGRVI|nr:hypothetical protein [Agrobacterium vitis]MBF2717006.1 hypothetical protein [Agrobacterium vitis]MUZ61514.1 hypothetical protein [Agrobacterium vitis]